MKKTILILLILMLACSQSAFAAWTFTKDSTRQVEDTLFVTATFTNGTVTVQEEVPVFRPGGKPDVTEALRNRALSIKSRVNAIARIKDVVKPDVDASIVSGGEVA